MNAPSPLNVYRFTVTWQDALAYERLPRDLPSLQKITLYLWLALAGIILVVLPSDVAGEVNSIRFWLTGAALVLLQYAIFVVLRAITRLNRARFRYPVPVSVVLEQWPDHLSVADADKPRDVRFEDMGALLPTAQRLFIASGADLIIVPVSAFGTEAGMAELVEAIDAYMRAKYQQQGAVASEEHTVDLKDPKA